MSSPATNDFTLEDFRRMLLKFANPSLLEKMVRRFVDKSVREKKRHINVKREVARTIGIIDSMTAEERCYPKLVDANRERRIAAGAGVTPRDVRSLLKQYFIIRPIMAGMAPPRGLLARLRWLRDIQSRDLRRPEREPPADDDGPHMAG